MRQSECLAYVDGPDFVSNDRLRGKFCIKRSFSNQRVGFQVQRFWVQRLTLNAEP